MSTETTTNEEIPLTKSGKPIRKTLAGETNLHVFCRAGNPKKIIELLNDGYSLNDRNNDDQTPTDLITDEEVKSAVRTWLAEQVSDLATSATKPSKPRV